jgi:integrase
VFLPRSARKASLETRTARLARRIRRAPYFVKIAKGLHLGYYRGAASGTWLARRYRGDGAYESTALGTADDMLTADGIKVFDYWQAQNAAKSWDERARLVEAGLVRRGPYYVRDAVADYLEEIRVEKRTETVGGAQHTFNAFILPELGELACDKLSRDRLIKWRNAQALRPKRVRSKKTATKPATHPTPDDEDARRKRKSTANRTLAMLKAALNRAYQAGKVPSDHAWRRVKPFAKVDEAVVRYLSADEAKRLVNACQGEFRRLVQAAILTGCRYSELARLSCVDFNTDSNTLAIRLSKAQIRHVVLTDDANRCFASWTAGKGASDRVFLRANGGVWAKSHQVRPLEDACKIAKISPPVSFHVLRHTHGSHLAMQGVPFGVIARQLGHSDTRMTEKHYAHLAPNYIADTIRAKFPNLGITELPVVVPIRAGSGHSK